MKNYYPLLLCLCGTAILITPYIGEYFWQIRIVEIRNADPEVGDLTLSGMSGDYALGCYIIGVIMVVASIKTFFRNPQ